MPIAMSTVGNIQENTQNLLVSSVLRPARILIVDDEAIVRDVLARKLMSLGYACESCDNGRAALDLLVNKKFDLVLADVLISEIQGTTLLKEALRVCPDIAVILVTSVVDIETA